MSERRYDVLFSGKLVEGAALDKVKANVAKLFKVEVAKVEGLFSGRPVAIKKGVNEQVAKKYLIAMKKAGAICQARAAAPAKAKAAPAAGKPTTVQKPVARQQAARNQGGTGQAAADAGEAKYVIKQPPAGLGELSEASVDEPGTVLVKHQDVPPPQVDTSGLSMDEPGATLVEHEETPPPQVDTSDLSMDEPGATIGEHEEEPELEVDLSGLSMDEPGATIVEHKDEPEPKIDTSKLSMS